jgi:hypothetical protein
VAKTRAFRLYCWTQSRPNDHLRLGKADLFRHELLMTLNPFSDKTIEEIVDTVFLPLVRLGEP